MLRELKPSKVRTEADRTALRETVGGIIDNVIHNGDNALIEYNSRFDNCERKTLRISREEIEKAYRQVSSEDLEDIRKAAANIRAFAEAQKGTLGELRDFSPSEGIMLGHRVIPVDSCCCYVPGGGYPLYSTALMLGIPAKTAGVRRVTACSPVIKGTDTIHPKTLVAMDIAGIDEIYDKYYAWNFKVIANLAAEDFSGDISMASRSDIIYFHVIVSGGPPGETKNVYYEASWPNGSKEVADIGTGWKDGSRGTARLLSAVPMFMKEGNLVFTIYDKNSQKSLGSKTVTLRK